MKGIKRYNEFKDDSLDQIMIKIRNGTIKSGQKAHLVKINKNEKIKGKELFKDGKIHD